MSIQEMEISVRRKSFEAARRALKRDYLGALIGINKRLNTALRHLRTVNDSAALEVTNVIADLKDIISDLEK